MTTVPESVRHAYGQLPDGWRLEKLKFLAAVRNSNVDKTIVEEEKPILLCNYTDVYYNDRIASDLDFMEGSATLVEIERFQLRQGQVIITKDSEGWDDIGIPALVTEDMPGVVCGYHLSIFEPNGIDLDGGYLAWLCRSEPLNDQFKLGANGVTRFGLGQYAMKNAFVSIPPIEVQRQIAKFLDLRTAQIDDLIKKVTGRTLGVKALKDLATAEERTLCGLLVEYRSALVTAAVTGKLVMDVLREPEPEEA